MCIITHSLISATIRDVCPKKWYTVDTSNIIGGEYAGRSKRSTYQTSEDRQ